MFFQCCDQPPSRTTCLLFFVRLFLFFSKSVTSLARPTRNELEGQIENDTEKTRRHTPKHLPYSQRITKAAIQALLIASSCLHPASGQASTLPHDRCRRGKAGPASPRPAHATPDLGHRSERRRARSRLGPADRSRVPDVRPLDRKKCSLTPPPCKGRGRRAEPAPPPTRSRRPRAR